MDLTALEAQDDDERELIRARASQIRAAGRLDDGSQFFPELDPDALRGYSRGPVPLTLQSLLYDEVVLYVPPLSRPELETRLGVEWDDLLELTDSGIVTPIVGHLTDYLDKGLDALLRERPPSIWARGNAVLEVLELEETLVPEACPLPVAQMMADPRLFERYGALLPDLGPAQLGERIQQEIMTNYADLCVVGERAVADSLAGLDDPSLILSSLLFAAETLSYPILFGAGGTANYDLARLEDLGWVDPRLRRALAEGEAKVLPLPELERLFKGIDLRIDRLTAADTIELHSSGTLTRVRRALDAFETSAEKLATIEAEADDAIVDEVEQRSAVLAELLAEAATDLSRVQRVRQERAHRERTSKVFRAGGLALGALSGSLLTRSPLAGLALLPLVEVFGIQRFESHAMRLAMERRFAPGLAELWEVKLGD